MTALEQARIEIRRWPVVAQFALAVLTVVDALLWVTVAIVGVLCLMGAL